jgi:hypothetical protein
MALRSPRTDLHPSSIQRTFTLPVAGSTPLADQLEPSNVVSPVGAPAANINHLPSDLHLIVGTTGTFVWTDLLGNSNTVTYPVGVFNIPYTFRTIEVGTAIGTLTVSWHPEA